MNQTKEREQELATRDHREQALTLELDKLDQTILRIHGHIWESGREANPRASDIQLLAELDEQRRELIDEIAREED
jgi:hypothetical protein